MNTLINNEINIGIDTSQTALDVYVRPHGHYVSFENNAQGIKESVKYIRSFTPQRVVIEATGRLELDFVIAADKAKLPVCVCNPMQIRQFAKAVGRIAKTDKLDAEAITHFGEAIKPPLSTLKPEKLIPFVWF